MEQPGLNGDERLKEKIRIHRSLPDSTPAVQLQNIHIQLDPGMRRVIIISMTTQYGAAGATWVLLTYVCFARLFLAYDCHRHVRPGLSGTPMT